MIRSTSVRGRRAVRVAVEMLENRLLMSANSWKSAVSGNWETASNWSLGHVPLSTEDVSITVPGTYTVSVHGTSDVANTIVLGSATAHATLNLTSNNTTGYAYVTAANGFTNNSIINLTDDSSAGYTPRINITSGVLTNTSAGTINASGTATASVQPDTIAGGFSNLGGKINVAGTWVLQVQGAVTLGATPLSGTGTLNLSSDTIAIASTGCTFANGSTTVSFQNSTINGPGTLTNAAGSTLVLYNTVVNAALINNGTIASHGTSSSINGAITTAAGSIINLISDNTIGYAYLTVANGFTNNGTINLTDSSSAGYTSRLAITTNAVINSTTGSIVASSTAGASVQPDTIAGGFSNLGGKITVSGTWVLQVQGAVTLGTTSLSGTGTLSLNSDTISIASTGCTFANGTTTVSFQNSTINGPGTLTNAAGSTLVLYNTVVNAALVNNGTIASHGTSSSINGAFTTAAGSIINLISDNTIGYAYLTVANGFTNNGTINLTDSSSAGYTSRLAITANALINSTTGSIVASSTAGASVQPDTIAGGFSNLGGKITVSGTWVLQIQGAITLGATTLPGTGTLSLSSDTVTIPSTGCMFASGKTIVTFQNSTINGPGTLTNLAGSTLTLYNTLVNAALVNNGTLVSHGTSSTIKSTFTTAAGSAVNLTSDNTLGYAYLIVANSFTNNGAINLTNNSSAGYTPQLIVSTGTLTNSSTGSIIAGGATTATQPDIITANVSNAGRLADNYANGITLTGTYTQTSTGTYAVTLPSTTHVSGAVTLSGLIDIYHTSAFKAVVGTKYAVLTYPSRSGDFTSHDGWSLGGGVQVNNAPAATEYDLLGAKAIADTTVPTVTAFTPITPVALATTATFSVTFADNVAIDVSTLGNSNVQVTGPGGFSQVAKLVSVSKTNNGTPRTATYSITPTVGRVDFEANGTYTASLLANSVKDTTGNAVAAAKLGTFAIAITPKLVFTTQPPSTVVAGKTISPALVVKIEDRAGNVLTTDTSKVTISVASGPSLVLGGTTTVSAVSGVATFSTLTLDTSGKYTLKAADGTDVTATSNSFTVNPGAAAKLVFTSVPTTGKAGAALSPAVKVTVEDTFGNVVITDSSTINMAIATGPTGGVLSGVISAKASAGIATFSGLLLNIAGAYTLKATDGALTSAVTTTSITIAAAAAAKLVIFQQPTTGTHGVTLSPVFIVDVEDTFGNIVTTDTSSVTLTLSTKPTGGALTGTATVKAVKGIATFGALSVSPAGNYVVTATDGSLTAAVSKTIVIK